MSEKNIIQRALSESALSERALRERAMSESPTHETDLSRRDFCKTALAGVAATTTGLHGLSAFAAEMMQPHEAFASSFIDVPEQFGPTKVSFDKPLPAGLSGTLYRNGPARMQRGNTSYRHWFDGDGMMHSFELQSNSVTHRGKMVRTDRLLAEEKAGRFLWGGFGTGFEDSLPVTSPDTLNVANISVLPVGDEVLALWEAGSPWRLDANTLDTLGRQVFSPETDGLPFSAHPRIDPTGRIWNFGYLSGSGNLVLYDLDPGGSLNRVAMIDAPNADMVHDFAITERYLVFVLLPLHFSANAEPHVAFSDQLQWGDDDPVHVLVVDKQTLQVAHRFELPAFFAFHLGNAWQDGESIRIEVATAPTFAPLMGQIVQATTGQPLNDPPWQPQTAEILLNLKGKTAQINRLPTSGIDFPRFDQRFTGFPTQQLFMMGRSADMPDPVFGFNSLTAMNRKTDSESTFAYSANTIAEEHLFVPAAGDTEGTGWMVGTSYDWKNQRSTISVFDAQHIADGPITQAELPYGLPLGLHGQFV